MMTTDNLSSKEKRLYDKFSRIAERRHVSDEDGVQEVVDMLTAPAMKAIPIVFVLIGFSAGLVAASGFSSEETPIVSLLIAVACFWAGVQNYRTINIAVPKIARIYSETLEPARPSKKKRKRLAQQEAKNDH